MNHWSISAASIGLMVFGGCVTPKEQIERSAAYASSEAVAVVASLESAEATGEVGPKALPFVREATGHANNVIGAASSISESLPGIRNVEPFWKTWAKRAALAAICGVGLWLLWPLLPGFVAWVVVRFPKMIAVIPRSIRSAAKFDAQVIAESQEGSPAHVVTALRREQSALYNAAFRVARAKQEARAE